MGEKRKEGIACKECGRTTAIIDISGNGRIEKIDFTCEDCDTTTKFKRKSMQGGTPVKMSPGQTALPVDIQKSSTTTVVMEPLPHMKKKGSSAGAGRRSAK